MSEFKLTIDPGAADVFISRVLNGWAIYLYGQYDFANGSPRRPIAVARNARELAGYLQSWAESQECVSGR